MSKIIKVKQRDITDCAAACLASVSGYYGLYLPVAKIRQFASTDKKGTNALGMVEAAEKLGFQAKGVKGEYNSLYKIPKPAIAHVVVKDVLHHYVIIYKVDKKYIQIMDPADGQLHKYKHNQFKKMWTGVLILLLPDNTFKQGNEKQSILKKILEFDKPAQINNFPGSYWIHTFLSFWIIYFNLCPKNC